MSFATLGFSAMQTIMFFYEKMTVEGRREDVGARGKTDVTISPPLSIPYIFGVKSSSARAKVSISVKIEVR